MSSLSLSMSYLSLSHTSLSPPLISHRAAEGDRPRTKLRQISLSLSFSFSHSRPGRLLAAHRGRAGGRAERGETADGFPPGSGGERPPWGEGGRCSRRSALLGGKGHGLFSTLRRRIHSLFEEQPMRSPPRRRRPPRSCWSSCGTQSLTHLTPAT